MAMDDCIKGFVVGGLIGAAFAILYAPKSGRETREGIRHSAEDLLEKAKEQYEGTSREIEGLIDREKEFYIGKKEKLKKAVQAGVEAYKQDAPAAILHS